MVETDLVRASLPLSEYQCYDDDQEDQSTHAYSYRAVHRRSPASHGKELSVGCMRSQEFLARMNLRSLGSRAIDCLGAATVYQRMAWLRMVKPADRVCDGKN